MTIRVHALEDTSDLRPDGDCYAPQVVLTHSHGWNVHELNVEQFLPFPSSWVLEVQDRFGSDHEMMRRYFRAFWDMDMHVMQTHGYSQGDWGHSYVFAPQEWLDMTGATGIGEADHNDFCAWLWGDVYEVFNDDPADLDPRCPGGDVRFPVGEHIGVISAVTEDEPMIVYGMAQAMAYGEITFPTHHSYTTYDY